MLFQYCFSQEAINNMLPKKERINDKSKQSKDDRESNKRQRIQTIAEN